MKKSNKPHCASCNGTKGLTWKTFGNTGYFTCKECENSLENIFHK